MKTSRPSRDLPLPPWYRLDIVRAMNANGMKESPVGMKVEWKKTLIGCFNEPQKSSKHLRKMKNLSTEKFENLDILNLYMCMKRKREIQFTLDVLKF